MAATGGGNDVLEEGGEGAGELEVAGHVFFFFFFGSVWFGLVWLGMLLFWGGREASVKWLEMLKCAPYFYVLVYIYVCTSRRFESSKVCD